MDQEEIEAGIRGFLENEFPNDAVELTGNTDLLEEWFIDSLGITELVIFLESEFALDITRADINGENFKDPASLSGFVLRRLAG